MKINKIVGTIYSIISLGVVANLLIFSYIFRSIKYENKYISNEQREIEEINLDIFLFFISILYNDKNINTVRITVNILPYPPYMSHENLFPSSSK